MVGGKGIPRTLVARRLSEGQLDTSFSRDGKVTFVPDHAGTRDVDVQNNGKIVVSNRPTLLVRLLPDGSLDTEFDGDGIVSLPGTSLATLIEPSGRIMVATLSPLQLTLSAYEGDPTGLSPQTLPDRDCDGVDDTIEESCSPEEKTEPNLTASPAATGLGRIIVESNCTQDSNVAAFTEQALGSDQACDYPFGFVGFTLNGCPNGQATVALAFEGANGLSASTFRKHAPTTPGGAPAVFYSLAELDSAAGGEYIRKHRELHAERRRDWRRYGRGRPERQPGRPWFSRCSAGAGHVSAGSAAFARCALPRRRGEPRRRAPAGQCAQAEVDGLTATNVGPTPPGRRSHLSREDYLQKVQGRSCTL
ncbi:MAG: hypothetical protein KatS3mg077_1319 [Candidatus Binatia bacterium]|nr:MAG: hypothetical protein KatS3mg077_1319 [Candidatus Binatia bacterium]